MEGCKQAQYAYISKFYRGVPVVTLLDLEFFTRVSRLQYCACIKQHKKDFLKGIDYWYLRDNCLFEFFYENPDFLSSKTRLFILSSPGLMKLSSFFTAENANTV